MYIKGFAIGPVSANCYVICDDKTKIGAVIDPGDFNGLLLKEIEKAGIEELKYILCTHAHFDHIAGAGRLKERFPEAKIAVGLEDSAALNDERLSLAAYFGAPFYPCVADEELKNGDVVTVGSLSFNIISAPGHTVGGVLYYEKKQGVLFTGDTLFKGSVGRTDFPGGSSVVLMNTLKKIKNLPEECVVYSGHGEKTTIKHEKNYNMYLI